MMAVGSRGSDERGGSRDLTSAVKRTTCSIQNVGRLEEEGDAVRRFLQRASEGYGVSNRLVGEAPSGGGGHHLGSPEGPGGQ